MAIFSNTSTYTLGTIDIPCAECLDEEFNTFYSYKSDCSDTSETCSDTGPYGMLIPSPAPILACGVGSLTGADMSALAGAAYTLQYTITLNDVHCGTVKTFASPVFGGNIGSAPPTIPEPPFHYLYCNSDPYIAFSLGFAPTPVLSIGLLAGAGTTMSSVSASITATIDLPLLDTGPGCFWKDFINCAETC